MNLCQSVDKVSLWAFKVKAIFTKLYLQDANFTLTYSLADVLILGKNTYYNDPEKWIIELNLTPDDVDYLM